MIHYLDEKAGQTTTLCGRPWYRVHRTANQHEVTCPQCRTVLGIAAAIVLEAEWGRTQEGG